MGGNELVERVEKKSWNIQVSALLHKVLTTRAGYAPALKGSKAELRTVVGM